MSNLSKDIKSWKTTLLGILGGLLVIIPQVIAVLDGNDATEFSLKAVIAGLALMGLGIAAKDGDKSTEDVE